MRLPIGIAQRAASLPETAGWIGLNTDIRYAADTTLPDVSGVFEAHGVRLDQYAFADDIASTLSIRRNVITSPLTTVHLARGTVTLTDTVVDPLSHGVRLEHTRLDGTGIDFTALLRALGVHPSSWVGWDIRELHVPVLAGSLVPLKIDGDLTAKTATFGVYDRPAEDHGRERIFGFSEAQIAARVNIRQDALRFVDVRATLPRSRVEGAAVSLGFDNELRIEAPNVHADLTDLSPIGAVAMRGTVEVSAKVGGNFNHPTPEGDIRSATNLVIADVAFGDVTAGHVVVDVKRPKIELSGVQARRRASPYEVPTARLDFVGGNGFVVDAQGASDAFGLRDLLSMFALDEDPRFDGLDATLAPRADVHVAVGGPEDACGQGYLSVNAKSRLERITIYGERFARGDSDVSLRWFNRGRGVAGAEIDLRSFVLEKLRPKTGTRAGAVGTLLGSAVSHRGGALSANISVSGLPLARIDALGALGASVDGSLSGVASVKGQLDAFLPDPGFVVRAAIDASGTRVRGVPLADSHLDVRMTNLIPREVRAVGHTRCGAPIAAPFDKQAYLADASPRGEWNVSGNLFGAALTLTDVNVTRARSPHVTGRASLRGVDVEPFVRILTKPETTDAGTAPPTWAVGGQVWGELMLDDVWLDAPARSKARLLLGPTFLVRGGQRITLRPPRNPIVVANDTLRVPPLRATLETPEGFRGGLELSGEATQLTTEANLAFAARIDPVDLAILERFVPKVDKAIGHIEGSLRLSGRFSSPAVAGELHLVGDDIEIRGLPSAVTDTVLDVDATATELTAAGTGKFAGGTIALHATSPVRGLEVGPVESRVTIRGVRLAPEEGVSGAFDADLQVAYDPRAQLGTTAALPHVGGEVTLDAVRYTRPITFNLDIASARAKRTQVETYDPALDLVALDVLVRSRSPIVIKNNLAEVQLGIDKSAPTVHAVLRNERFR